MMQSEDIDYKATACISYADDGEPLTWTLIEVKPLLEGTVSERHQQLLDTAAQDQLADYICSGEFKPSFDPYNRALA
jgi:hypothetical protein